MKTIALLLIWSLVVGVFGNQVDRSVGHNKLSTMSKLSLRNKEAKDAKNYGLFGYVTSLFRSLHSDQNEAQSDGYEYDNYTEGYEYDNYTNEYGYDYEYDNVSYEGYEYDYDNVSYEYGYESYDYDNFTYEYGYEYDNFTYEYGYEYDNATYEYGYEYDNATYEYGYEYDNVTYEYGYEYDNVTYEYGYEYDGNVTNSPTLEKPHCDGEKFYCNNFWSYDNGYSGIGLPCADFTNGPCGNAETWSSWRCCTGDLGVKTLDEWKDFCENKGLEVCLRA